MFGAARAGDEPIARAIRSFPVVWPRRRQPAGGAHKNNDGDRKQIRRTQDPPPGSLGAAANRSSRNGALGAL
jgi:hypothetical protein